MVDTTGIITQMTKEKITLWQQSDSVGLWTKGLLIGENGILTTIRPNDRYAAMEIRGVKIAIGRGQNALGSDQIMAYSANAIDGCFQGERVN